MLAGFPYQAFSIIGRREGFDDTARGTLFFEILRILRDRRPRAFMLENVKNLTSHDNGRTYSIIMNALEGLGYCVYSRVMNALDYGLPQKRERIIIAGFRESVMFAFPDPVPECEHKTLADILESAPSAKYCVSE